MSALPISSTMLPTLAPPAVSEPVDWPSVDEDFEFAPFQADKAAVAALGPVEIARLTRRELIAAVVAAELPVLQPDPGERLQYLDRWTLERLVYLARYCCRNQGY